MRLQTAAGWRSLLLSSLLCTGAWAKKDKPSHKSTKFDFIPYNVNYFEDSDVILFEDRRDHDIHRSDDAGENWKKIERGAGKMLELVMHPFDHVRAYIITEDRSHWMTKDQGKSWEEFTTDVQASIFREALTFHAGDPDRIIFNGMDCTGIFCEELTLYTTNGFTKDSKFLRSDTAGCHWAKSSELFITGQKDLDADRILCVVKGRFSPWRKDYRLLVSDNFFNTDGEAVREFEPELEVGRTVQGIVNMAVVKKHLIVAASAEGTDEMALYVSDDTIRWHRAIFPHDHKLTEEAYTVLEGTNYSIQIDVMNSRPTQPMGVFLSSNSNGTYFTRNIEHTNRNKGGHVDFEKIAGIQGIVLVNIVDNWKEVQDEGKPKKIKSVISFDDGRDFKPLTVDKEELHLHSVTDLSNSGRVFSSPAPGLVMGVGNTGKYLGEYMEGNLYVSDDAGVTWRQALKGPHKYEFGDQGSILVAVEEGYHKEIAYSLNHGKDWDTFELEHKFKAVQLTTTQDSTSLKFLLEAVDDNEPSVNGYIIAIDFDDMHEAQCTSDDVERWPARVDDAGEASCLMGQKQYYQRRRANAKCFMKKEFEDPEVETEPCECTDDDYECDYNFERSEDRKECNPAGAVVIPDGACKNPDDTFMGSSGWRKIPGDNCKGGKKKDEPKEWKCADDGVIGKPASGDIDSTTKDFPGKTFTNIVYLERTGISSGEDETVLMRTDKGVFLSDNQGKTWKQILKEEAIIGIYPHPHFNDVVFFLTPTKKVFYSTERGKHIRSFKAPHPPNSKRVPVMNFHPKNKDWIIWIGGVGCERGEESPDCHSVASLTLDRGDHWNTLQRYVRKCEFIKETETGYLTPDDPNSKESKNSRDKLIYCETRMVEDNDRDDNPLQLVSSDDFFEMTRELRFKNIIDFATMSEFIVVATKDEEKQTLKLDASVDGERFADAKFPSNFQVDHQQGYTVLDSSTHSVFLHVTVNNDKGYEYGTIIKSNSNGTSYVLSLNGVDRDTTGYVDFEKMFGIEGVAMVNVVANYDDKNYKKDGKKLKTMITHNDGAEWDYLAPPAKDPEDKKYPCSSPPAKCALHIHGYTERSDKSHTYSSASAVGLMLGTGNVGEYLTGQKDADTFMTSDGGITWKSVKKDSYMWEFGDQGSIVVIVLDSTFERKRTKTNVVYYTVDEGDTWKEYKFSDKEIEINDLTTVPSDNSRNFLLWGWDDDEDKLVTINLDFSGLTDIQCKLDEADVNGGDYYLWTPKHPKQENDCLFGHVSQYHRKKTEAKCYNGRMVPHLHDIAENCTCTRRDYECDYNFQRDASGNCKPVPGISPVDHSLTCKQDSIEWYEVTGYRRIPITTCEGGNEMDKGIARKCPGHDDEFNKKHGVSGVAIFFAVVIPFAVAGGVGYWVWKNWANKFGQIRLGEQSSFDGEAPYIKYPVLVIAGLVAVAQALPLLASSLWRSASNMLGRGGNRRFTTRDSFARGRGDYAVVDEDEGELLGDESDEEV